MKKIITILGYKKIIKIFFMICFVCLYSIMYVHLEPYLDGCVKVFSVPWFIILSIFVMLYATISVNKYYEKNYNFLARIENRGNYIKQVVKSTTIITSCIYLIMIVLAIALCPLLCKMKPPLLELPIPRILYIGYTAFKFYLLNILLAILSSLLLLKFNQTITIICNLTLPIFAFLKGTYVFFERFNIGSFSFDIRHYFDSLGYFPSFIEEVFCFIIFYILFINILILIYKFVTKTLGDIK